jgi:hypothetical protein
MGMNVTATRIIETCLDGTMNVEKMLDRAMDRKFIHHLAVLGNFEYFPQFARPFFRITRPGIFVIKGVEGEISFEVFIIRVTGDLDDEIATVVSQFNP